jgi:hypothetical protein
VNEVCGPPESLGALQVWIPIISWYVEQRKYLEEQVKKYSDPPSEHLLPDLPPHARCAAGSRQLHASCVESSAASE